MSRTFLLVSVWLSRLCFTKGGSFLLLQVGDIVKAVANCSYNQLVEKIICCKQSDNSELRKEGGCGAQCEALRFRANVPGSARQEGQKKAAFVPKASFEEFPFAAAAVTQERGGAFSLLEREGHSGWNRLS